MMAVVTLRMDPDVPWTLPNVTAIYCDGDRWHFWQYNERLTAKKVDVAEIVLSEPGGFWA